MIFVDSTFQLHDTRDTASKHALQLRRRLWNKNIISTATLSVYYLALIGAGASLTPVEAQTPRRPPNTESSLKQDQQTTPLEPQAMTPRALWMNDGNIDDAAARTPCRSTAGNHTEAIASVATRSTTINMKENGNSNKGAASGGEGFKTPTPKIGACAICLSPLVKRDVYTVQLCRHNFHRGCLAENRRAGNIGCPCCRGTLEGGLTPVATAAEREALVAAARQEEQRQAIRNAAARARMALANRRGTRRNFTQ